jgi:hypothetical protein
MLSGMPAAELAQQRGQFWQRPYPGGTLRQPVQVRAIALCTYPTVNGGRITAGGQPGTGPATGRRGTGSRPRSRARP